MATVQRIETDDIIPGDRIDLRELADELVAVEWMKHPWSGRGEEWVRSERDLAKVSAITLTEQSIILTFENFSPWFIARGVTITAHAPH